MLASETQWAGRVLLSRCQLASEAQKQCRAAIAHLDRALEACKCSRRFAPDEILTRDWAALTDAELAPPPAAKCGCRQASCEKLHFDEHKAFGLGLCFLEQHLTVLSWKRTSRPSSPTPPAGRCCGSRGLRPPRTAGWS